MKISPGLVLGSALALCGACCVQPARAQEQQTAPVDAPTETFQLLLRHVKAGMVAYWLDPQHYPRPVELGPDPDSQTDVLPSLPERTGAPVSVLPPGIERMVVLEEQKRLEVTGTKEGVLKLRLMLGFLDRPLREVEIDTQLVRVSAEDVAAFGIDFTTARGNFNANEPATAPEADAKSLVGFVRGDFAASLVALKKANKIEVLSAPLATVINNANCLVEPGGASPAPVVKPAEDAKGDGAVAPPTGETAKPLARFQMFVTPTINNDDTVTMMLRAGGTLQGVPETPDASSESQRVFSTLAIANAKDGATIALRLNGLDPRFVEALFSTNRAKKPVPELGDIPLISNPNAAPDLSQIPTIGKLFRSKTAASDQLILFVTPHIVRYLDDLRPLTR